MLTPLIGLPVWDAGRAGDVLWLQFGDRRVRPTDQRGAREVGEYALHVSCAWRVVGPTGILAASGDVFTPADPDANPATFEWDRPGANWCDVRLRAFIEATGASPPLVLSVSADELGGLQLSLAGGFTLEVFPDSSHAKHVETEFWRLLQPGTAAPHFVAGSAGMDRWPTRNGSLNSSGERLKDWYRGQPLTSASRLDCTRTICGCRCLLLLRLCNGRIVLGSSSGVRGAPAHGGHGIPCGCRCLPRSRPNCGRRAPPQPHTRRLGRELPNGSLNAGAPALRWFRRGVNIVMLCFAIVSGIVGGASAVQLLVVVGLMGTTTLLSIMPTPASDCAAV